MRDFELIRVSSTNLHSVGYDTDSQTMRVRFNRGAIYDHYDVPENIHEGLMKAGSKGHFYRVNIERRFRHKRIL